MGAYLFEMFFVCLTLTIIVELAVISLCTRIYGEVERRERRQRCAGEKCRIGSFLPAVCEKRGILLVVLVNVLTNPPAVFVCWIGRRYAAEVPVFLLQLAAEAAVVAAEACIYRSFAKETAWGIRHPVTLSVTANLCSWLCGVSLTVFRNI